MKVSGTGGLTPSSGAKPAKAGSASGFAVSGASTAAPAAAATSVGRASGVVGVEALLALQDVQSPLERRRKSVARAGRLLDGLEELKIGLLEGSLDGAQIETLRRAVREQRAGTDDPALEEVLDQIETRAAVELAKLSMRSTTP